MTQSTIFPKKLKRGSHIRIIAPSRSASILTKELINHSKARLEEFGFKISFGKNIYESDDFSSSSVASRIADLHDAYKDKDVDAILTVIGGYNANQILDEIDYNLIENNPKILCGFSDITTLSNAIYAQTQVATYSGPHFSSWGMKKEFEYSIKSFKKALMSDAPYDLEPSSTWSDDMWFIDQNNRKLNKNKGLLVIQEGEAQGRIVGGHARCLSSLQGTKYWPSLEDTILFIEEDEETSAELFDRLVQSFIHQSGFNGVKGIVVGRFQNNSKVSDDTLRQIFESKKALKDIPIIANANFGHTTPIGTFPVGGEAKIIASKQPAITILSH